MTWISGIFTFVLIWWVVLFAVLPWGVQVADQPEEGHATSAPKKPYLWQKALATTLVTLVIWFAVFYVVEADLVSFRP